MFSFFVFVYIVNASFLVFMGLHAWLACLQFRKGRLKKPLKINESISFPKLLIQLPLYNESTTIIDLLSSIDKLEYPNNLLHIQILDDSNDDTTSIISNWLKLKKNHCYSLVRRESREGFKAGALKYGMNLRPEDFILILDSDFRPKSDFILKTFPTLLSNEDLALVQTRWSYTNSDENFFTRFQAVGMDGHFAIEQPARAWNNLFMNFNGTAGIWRRKAIIDGGNWQGDTLTEDLDLSYRVQLKNWKMTYLLDVDCPSEIPNTIFAFKSQQFRWAKGSIQTAKKLLIKIFRSKYPIALKIEALFHLTHYLIHPVLILNFIIGCFLLLNPQQLNFIWVEKLMFLILFAAMGPGVLYKYSQNVLNKHPKGGVFFYLAMVSLGCGMAWNNTRAVFEAFIGKKSAFIRTPKQGDDQTKYKANIDYHFLIELSLSSLGLYTLSKLGILYFYLFPFLSLYTIGFMVIGLKSALEVYSQVKFSKNVVKNIDSNEISVISRS
ncbi:MAG: glycosyl transferase family 2 [Candidatus Cloacimonadota bacterium]|nr:MAG: glycosyl transferase family 2 [Candidatus Cloacimonadota bacterium]